MKLAAAIVLFLAGIAAVLVGLYAIHPGLALAVAGATAIRHALTMDEGSRDEA